MAAKEGFKKPWEDSMIELGPKQKKLLELLGKQFPKYYELDQASKDNIIIKIKGMGALDYLLPEQIDLEEEFNDLIYVPDARFFIPPASYFDTKKSYWASRKQRLIQKYGNFCKTKDNLLAFSSLLNQINQGTSLFDPVLCEVIISWFNTYQGRILNPFCGEASIALISGTMGCEFFGVEIRQEQVDINREIIDKQGIVPKPVFLRGNSLNLDTILDQNKIEGKFDLIFSSPPYYDLEIYSDEGGDLSNKQSYAEFMKDYETIFGKALERLNNNRFLVVKVGEIRDPDGVYRNFVGDNITVFKRLGLKYYNEIILMNPMGTAPMRFGQCFKARKIVKVHQNVLVFFKGDVRQIPHIYKRVNDPCDITEKQQELKFKAY